MNSPIDPANHPDSVVLTNLAPNRYVLIVDAALAYGVAACDWTIPLLYVVNKFPASEDIASFIVPLKNEALEAGKFNCGVPAVFPKIAPDIVLDVVEANGE